MNVLITGGAGYIGSTICSALENYSYTPVVLDSLVSGREEFTRGRIFYKGDICNEQLLSKIYKEHPFDHVIHCAGLIVVPDSVKDPFAYYNENVCKSVVFFNSLKKLNVKKIIISSSASIYGEAKGFVYENSTVDPQSPYAKTKYMMELILADYCNAYGMQGIALRYFNPIGADPQCKSGPYIQNPSSLMGKLVEAARKGSTFYITGTSWDTRDGTGLRDYIHIWDLAEAHVAALIKFDSFLGDKPFEVLNIGNGQGTTVLEMIAAFESVFGKKMKTEKKLPRQGDIAGACANIDKARKYLGYKANFSIEDAIAHALRWDEIWRNRGNK